jgi:hypothetical protein
MVPAQARQTHGGSNRRQSGGAVTPVSFKYSSISALAPAAASVHALWPPTVFLQETGRLLRALIV